MQEVDLFRDATKEIAELVGAKAPNSTKETNMKIEWEVTAEHTGGASVGHPCTRGAYPDPAELFAVRVSAETNEAATTEALRQLEEQVKSTPVCGCRRKLQPGSKKWWESIVLHAVPAVYEYLSDEWFAYLNADDADDADEQMCHATAWKIGA